jgi:hypothetical protein
VSQYSYYDDDNEQSKAKGRRSGSEVGIKGLAKFAGCEIWGRWPPISYKPQNNDNDDELTVLPVLHTLSSQSYYTILRPNSISTK